MSSAAPSTGPAAGTLASIIATVAMPRTASASDSVARTTLGTTTVAAPAAMPCSKRIASNTSMLPASAQPMLVNTRTAAPISTQRRGPMRFSASPHSSCEAAKPARNTATVACA